MCHTLKKEEESEALKIAKKKSEKGGYLGQPSGPKVILGTKMPIKAHSSITISLKPLFNVVTGTTQNDLHSKAEMSKSDKKFTYYCW